MAALYALEYAYKRSGNNNRNPIEKQLDCKLAITYINSNFFIETRSQAQPKRS